MSHRRVVSSAAAISADNGELPEGWAPIPLSQVTQSIANVDPHDEPQCEFGYIDISSIDNATFRVVDARRFKGADAPSRARRPIQPGDVLFSNVRTYLRNIAMVPAELDAQLCSTGFTVIRSNGAADPKYLFYYALTDDFVNPLSEQQTGSSYPAVTDRIVMKSRIPLAPLPEQKRIVAKVDALLSHVTAGRERLAKVPAILKRFRQSVLAAACSGQLTADWREEQRALASASELIERVANRRKDRWSAANSLGKLQRRGRRSEFDSFVPRLRDDLELFELPAAWQWVDLRFVMDDQSPFCYGVVQPGANNSDGVPLVRAGDLKDGTVNTTELRRIPANVDAEYKRSRLEGGEVLVTVVGASIGTSAIAPVSCRGFNIARAVAKVPIRDFEARYVYTWLTNPTAIGWMKRDAREVARPTLNLEQLRTLPVPLPPLPEQKEIVRRVESLFGLANQVERRLESTTRAANALVQSILASAFSGELVEPEAHLARRAGRDYESAIALLDRIKATQPAPRNARQ